MKRLLKWTVICYLCIITWGGKEMFVYASESATDGEIKVLMVGNSFTYRSASSDSVELILEEIAEQNNKNIDVTTIAYGGAYLSYYAFWSDVYWEYYDKLLSTLREQQFDYIVLQDQTKCAIEKYESDMLPAAKQLYKYIYTYQNNAKVLLYETAGYVDGTNTVVDGKAQWLTIKEFQERTLYGYTRLQHELNVSMIPVGMRVYHANELYPTIDMVDVDLRHPSYAGYYITALSIYYEIYGEKPVSLADSLTRCDIGDEQLALLNELVDDSIKINRTSLTIGVNQSETLVADIEADETRKGTLSWISLDTDIADVDKKTGKVIGKTEGTTAVIAETSTGLMAVCCVTVENNKVPEMSFGREYYQVFVGDNICLIPRIRKWQVTDDYKWSSSNTAVATVSSNGTVTARKMGKAVIKVRSRNDSSVTASYVLYVVGKSPTNLSAKIISKNATGGKVRLSWSGVYGATRYRIYRYDNSTKVYKLIGTSKTTQYTDSSVKANRYYYYKITASAGSVLTEGKMSKKVRIIIPGAVKAQKAIAGSKRIKISWSRNAAATGYVVYRSTKKNSGYKKIATIRNNKKLYYKDSTAKTGKTYYYRIKVYRADAGKNIYSVYSNAIKS